MSIVSADEAIEHLNTTDEDEDELQRFIDAVSAHIERRYGTLPSGTYTEVVTVTDDGQGVERYWLRPNHTPIQSITSATDEYGNSIIDAFTVSADGYAVRHPSITYGEWTLIYTAGADDAPADLKLAALEDIRGVWQPGQIGPPAAFGAFGIDSTDTGTTYRPVRMWPRVDAWIEANTLPGIA